MIKPYIKKGKLYLEGKKQKGDFISPLVTVARSLIFPFAKKLYFQLQKKF